MATFNILSSCICRDAFGLQKDDQHEVVTFLQSSSPITWFELNDKPAQYITMEDLDNIPRLSNFQKKCIINDYNKTVLEQYTQKTDFFITDLVSFASTGLGVQIYPDGIKHYFTFSKWFQIALTGGLTSKLVGNIEHFNRFAIINNELIQTTIKNYIQWIKSKGYNDDQIIIVENKRVNCYSDGKYWFYFENDILRDRVNSILDRVYNEFEKQLPNCHVIKMPIGVYADTHHIWGLNELHYCKEYYNYLYECFDMIANGCHDQQALYALREQYSILFLKDRDVFVANSLQSFNSQQLLKGNLCGDSCGQLVATIGSVFYKDSECKSPCGTLKNYISTQKDNIVSSQITINNITYYVNNDNCIRGYCGDNKKIGCWNTANTTTLAEIKDYSIVISHNGISSLAQTQIIQTIENTDNMIDKPIVFSVYARVLELNNDGKGGQIAIINATDYNNGTFYAKTEFNNKEWKRILLFCTLPSQTNFKGLTVCLRAIAGNSLNPKHAKVEFAYPKLEIGTYATEITF